MANAIGETRAVARQGSSQHDEMDGWPARKVGVDGISGRGCRQDKRSLHLHATALYLDWLELARQETGAGGFGSQWLRAWLGIVSQGKELGWTHPDFDD